MVQATAFTLLTAAFFATCRGANNPPALNCINAQHGHHVINNPQPGQLDRRAYFLSDQTICDKGDGSANDPFSSVQALKNDAGLMLEIIGLDDPDLIKAAFMTLSVFATYGISPNVRSFDTDWHRYIDPKRAEEWGKAMTANHIAYLFSNIAICQSMWPLIKYIPPASLATMGHECLRQILDEALVAENDSESQISVQQVFRWPKDIFNRFISVIANVLTTKNLVSALDPSSFKMVFDGFNTDNCASLTDDILKKYISDRDKIPEISQKCAKFINPKTTGPDTPGLGEKFFANVLGDNLESEGWENISNAQIQNFNTDVPLHLGKCYYLAANLSKVPEDLLKDITKDCWSGIMNTFLVYSGDISDLGARMNFIPADVISNLTQRAHYQKLYTRFPSESWSESSVEVVNALLSNPLACPDIPIEALEKSELVVDPVCFGVMSPASQVEVMKNAKSLPNDLFKFLKTKDVRAWPSKGDVSGDLGAVQHLVGHENVDKIVKSISAYDGGHPCAGITLEILKTTPVLTSHMSATCFQAMDMTLIKEEDWDELPKRLWALQPIDKIIRIVQNWATLEDETIKNMISGGQFCLVIAPGIISKLSDSAVKVIDADCFAQLPSKSKYDSKVIQSMLPSAMRKVTAAMATEIKVADFTDEQLHQMSADVADLDHIASTFTKEDVAGMSATRFGVLDDKAIGAMKAEAFEGIDKEEKLKAVPAASLVRVTLQQAEKIPIAVLKTISPEQVKSLGANVEGDNSGLMALKSILDQLSAESREAAENRLRENSGTIVGINIATLVAIVCVAFLLPQL